MDKRINGWMNQQMDKKEVLMHVSMDEWIWNNDGKWLNNDWINKWLN